jgi:CHAT domain-containing protein
MIERVPEYDDLQIRIDREGAGSYRVLALARGGRTGRGTFDPPITDNELDGFVQRVGLARRRRGPPAARMQEVKNFGSQLFDALIKDQIARIYEAARTAAQENGRGLRITLQLSGAPELMRLPWEFLYQRPFFLSQSSRTPLVRSLDIATASRPQRVRLPLRILGMVSSPSGYQELDAGAERRKLEQALDRLRRDGLVELDWLDHATLADFGRRISEPDDIHVVHYIGHGAYDEGTEDGILVLETAQGRAHDVSGEDLGAMLQDEDSLRLVVLNSCEGARTSYVDPFSGVATSLMQFGIPAVIGMQFEITDEAAIAFSDSLYTALAQGLPIDAALAPARRAIVGVQKEAEFGTPVLFLRGANARLFDVEQAPLEADERARREADQKAEREAEEPRREAEQKAEREAEEPRREAEQKAEREAEEPRREAVHKTEREAGVAAAWRPSRSTAYFVVTGVLAILGILLAFFGPESPVTNELTWDVDSHTTHARADLPEGTAGLSPTLLGLDLPGNPIPLDVDGNTFDIGPQRLLLAGPAIAAFDPSGDPVRLVRSGGSWWSPLLTIPGVVMVLAALFSFAYGESRLRSVRKGRGTVRRAELVAMAGVGAVLGGVIAVASWIAGNVPAASSVLGVVFCLTAAAGLLPYAVAALPQHRDVILAAVPLALLAVLSITWTAVGISGGGQGDETPAAPSSAKSTTPPAPVLKWQRGTDLPEPLEAAGVTVFGNTVWVVGGNAPSAGRPALDKVWFHKNGWQPGPKLPVRLDSMSVASDGKRLFVVGGRTTDSKGRNQKISRDVWVLDGPDDDSWKVLNRLPEERAGGAVAWDGQRLVFAGGVNRRDVNGDGKAENVNHADVWVWEGKDEWREIGQLQQQREDLVAASDGNGRAWFLGGADVREEDRRVPLGAVDLVESDRITPLSDIEPVRSSAAVWLADRGVCLFGGVTRTTADPKDSLTTRVVCVPETARPSQTFRPLPPLTLPRAGIGAALRGKTIWLAGGFGPERKDGPGRSGLAVVEVLVLS